MARRSCPPVLSPSEAPFERASVRRVLRSVGELLAPELRLLELGQRRRALDVARRLVVAPTAGPLPHAPRVRLDGRDAIDRSVEELSIVRYDDERAAVAGEKPLESLEAREVEVVRRLVEEQDVEAREQDRRECHTGCLAAREADELSVEIDAETEVGACRTSTRLEALRTECDEAVERSRVLVACGPSARESSCRLLELPLRVRDPDPPSKRRQHRSARLGAALLLEVPHGQALWRTRHHAGVRRLEPGNDSQQGRLAHTVRADQPDACLRADGERDLIENDVRAEVLADARELHSHGRTSKPW